MRIHTTESRSPNVKIRTLKYIGSGAAVLALVLFTQGARAEAGLCTQTAQLLNTACKASVSDDMNVRKAICINISNSAERSACLEEVQGDKIDGLKLCAEQKDWRLATCKLTGEGRYDPAVDPANFDTDFSNLTKPNPYFPLTIGNTWDFVNGNETDHVAIVNEIKNIQGVNCVVIRDQVSTNGILTEGTDDWYAQNKNGNVWYFGEGTGEYESYAGDNPMQPELVAIDGSFKGGRNGDKGGIIALYSPQKGDVITEEFSLGNAEDVTVILSNNYSYGHDAELDQLVPPALAALFCANSDCIVTKNFSLLEPNVFARKYYGKGIGVFLEVEVNLQEAVQLVGCNFDSRCASLPTP